MMKDGISRVITFVEKGKIGNEKASELFTIFQGKEQPELVKIKKDFPFGKGTLTQFSSPN